MSKYGVISGPYFPVFGINTGKYGPEITPYLDSFHAVVALFNHSMRRQFSIKINFWHQIRLKSSRT